MPPMPSSAIRSKDQVSVAKFAGSTKKVKSAAQLRIAKLVNEAMEHFANCLFEVKTEYRTLAFNLLELNTQR